MCREVQRRTGIREFHLNPGVLRERGKAPHKVHLTGSRSAPAGRLQEHLLLSLMSSVPTASTQGPARGSRFLGCSSGLSSFSQTPPCHISSPQPRIPGPGPSLHKLTGTRPFSTLPHGPAQPRGKAVLWTLHSRIQSGDRDPNKMGEPAHFPCAPRSLL